MRPLGLETIKKLGVTHPSGVECASQPICPRWEAKHLLATLQQHLVEQQATAFVAAHAQCDHCGKSLGINGYHTRTFRTLFGTVTFTSPRLYHCHCQRRKTTTFRPLNALLTDAVAPELLFWRPSTPRWCPMA